MAEPLDKAGRVLVVIPVFGEQETTHALLDDLRSEADHTDVVYAHALEGGWFSYPALARLSRRTPTVVTLHDMWPFTGHCSFSFGCDRWRTGRARPTQRSSRRSSGTPPPSSGG